MRRPLRAERFFLAASLLLGGAFALVTPPFQAPDEPGHFFRAFAVSEGALWAERRPGRVGAEVPASLMALAELYAGVAFHPERRVEPGTFATARRLELEPGDRRFVDFPGSAIYTAVPYLPQAAGIAAGRWVSAPPLLLVYLARLTNLLTASLLIYLALSRLPSYRWLAALLALTPMAVFLRASASADALTLAAALLFASSVAGPAFAAGGTFGWRRLGTAALAAALLAMSKAVYWPILAAPLAIPRSRFPRGRPSPAIAAYGAIVGFALLAALATARSVDVPLRAGGSDAERQIAGVFAEPMRFLGVVASDYARHAPRYAAELVGRLGWLDTPLPWWLLVAYAAGLLALVAVDVDSEVDVDLRQRVLLAALTAATLMMISGALYAGWTPVGASFVEGLQGRYFLPLAPLAMWIFHSRRVARVPPERRALPAALLAAAALAVSVVVLIRRYYL